TGSERRGGRSLALGTSLDLSAREYRKCGGSIRTSLKSSIKHSAILQSSSRRRRWRTGTGLITRRRTSTTSQPAPNERVLPAAGAAHCSHVSRDHARRLRDHAVCAGGSR